MEFLKEAEFWIVLFLSSIFCILFFVSGYIKVSWNMKFKNYTGSGLILYLFFFFLQFGWQAGISAIVFLITWAFLSNPIIKYIARKLNPEAFTSFNIIEGIPRQKNYSSLENYLPDAINKAEKNASAVRNLKQDDKLISVLKKYNKPSTELEEIYQVLLACGTNNYIAFKVVSKPKFLNDYLELKSKGMSDFDAAFKIASSLK